MARQQRVADLQQDSVNHVLQNVSVTRSLTLCVGVSGLGVFRTDAFNGDAFIQRSSYTAITPAASPHSTVRLAQTRSSLTQPARQRRCRDIIDVESDLDDIALRADDLSGGSTTLRPGRNYVSLTAYKNSSVSFDFEGNHVPSASIQPQRARYHMNKGGVGYRKITVSRTLTVLGRLLDPQGKPLKGHHIINHASRGVSEVDGFFSMELTPVHRPWKCAPVNSCCASSASTRPMRAVKTMCDDRGSALHAGYVGRHHSTSTNGRLTRLDNIELPSSLKSRFGRFTRPWFCGSPLWAQAGNVEVTALFRPDPTNPMVNKFTNTTPSSGYCEHFWAHCQANNLFSLTLPLGGYPVTSGKPVQANHPDPRQGAYLKTPSQWRRLSVTNESGDEASLEIRISGIGGRADHHADVGELTGGGGYNQLWSTGRWHAAPAPCVSGGGLNGTSYYVIFM